MRRFFRKGAAEEIAVRRMEPDDVRTLLAIDKLCFPPEVSFDSISLMYYAVREGSCTLVVEEEGRIEGFVVAQEMDADLGQIVTLDVHPRARGRGHGTRLMRAAEAELARRGMTRVQLQVDVENHVAIHLYEGLKYHTVEVLVRYYQNRRDAYLMEKALEPPDDGGKLP